MRGYREYECNLGKERGLLLRVKRAVDTVYERILEKEPLYTFGPIIHNEEVVRDLEKKGVVVVNDVDELAGKPQGTVIIRHTAWREVSVRKYRRLVFPSWTRPARLC